MFLKYWIFRYCPTCIVYTHKKKKNAFRTKPFLYCIMKNIRLYESWDEKKNISLTCSWILFFEHIESIKNIFLYCIYFIGNWLNRTPISTRVQINEYTEIQSCGGARGFAEYNAYYKRIISMCKDFSSVSMDNNMCSRTEIAKSSNSKWSQ
jgi:hypothetical protein